MEDNELAEQTAKIEQLLLGVGWLEQRRLAQDLAGLGLTPPQFFVLRSILSRGEQPTMGTLAYDTLQHCATVTGIVDRLARMGLVTRKRDSRDRRQVLVELTEAGRDMIRQVRQRREMRLRQALLRLSAEEARQLLGLLQLYLETFREQQEGAEDA